VVFCSGVGRGEQMEELTTSNLPAFLANFTQDINQVDDAFKQLSHSKLALFDQTGHPLGRRKIKDRRQTLVDLRLTLKDFEKRPRDLVVTMTLSDQTEELADEVYDLSQVAYDNDREELGLDLTDALNRFNKDADLLEAYALELATENERQLNQLEKK
ncbi:MAG: hypothetical protein ACRD2B_08920, partial [Terriglobia bacterium]